MNTILDTIAPAYSVGAFVDAQFGYEFGTLTGVIKRVRILAVKKNVIHADQFVYVVEATDEHDVLHMANEVSDKLGDRRLVVVLPEDKMLAMRYEQVCDEAGYIVVYCPADFGFEIPSHLVPLKVGTKTTCQLGNKFDTSGYREYAEVEVIGALHNVAGIRSMYLIKVDGVEMVGRASRPHHNPDDSLSEKIKGELYCTNARSYGSNAKNWTGIKTLAQAVASLGFDAEPFLNQ